SAVEVPPLWGLLEPSGGPGQLSRTSARTSPGAFFSFGAGILKSRRAHPKMFAPRSARGFPRGNRNARPKPSAIPLRNGCCCAQPGAITTRRADPRGSDQIDLIVDGPRS
ncbi:hypothetical protein ODJ79_44080, partial [Actinoplanes sp. KI2]|uniref:hypothetical protein n=1 Tax=Actinoplanes sp. KI2 TaxID=2983315 RepID=UPI0021D5F94C